MAIGSKRARAAAALGAIERLESMEGSSEEVVEELAGCVVRVIDADAFFLGATDPDTGLCMGAAIYNFDERACVRTGVTSSLSRITTSSRI